MIGLTVKTLVGILSGSTFVHFAQPIATTLALAAVFLGSVAFGRPLVARIAHDFCPIAPEVASRPAVRRLFIGLTVLWAVVQLCTAGATLGKFEEFCDHARRHPSCSNAVLAPPIA